MKRTLLLLAVVLLLLLGLPSAAVATPPSGPVSIEVINDFSALPFQGVFQVTQGAGILGCASGTTELDFRGILASATVVQAYFDCGDNGTVDFMLQFNPGQRTAPPLTGRWQARDGMGDWEGLRGQGVWHFDGFLETFTGNVHFDP